ncbi:Demethylmenaquinone methyltransferase [Seminavis robusta]|uniref:Demethylmenaquinone methyltransferase n=1 Tax=Seminavis robusta TaxID=568900 RepID=A0A9N8HHI7_9STRA|nr:Demethylmenaquinone methyltransferase [Seminavis robusta]|eukprot:Sro565_g167530.1 Demethylmenaquinone methyltransferase (358) ;mRNA; f:9502-11323
MQLVNKTLVHIHLLPTTQTYNVKMKLALFTIIAFTSSAAVGAFVPQNDLQHSLEAMMKRTVETTLKSSRAEPLLEPVTKRQDQDDSRIATTHKRWGVDNKNEEEYWYDSRIHTLGNHGFFGAVHAALAPISTKMIDNIAYEGVDIRGKVAEELSTLYRKKKANVLDLCCGVGFSTRALIKAFPDAERIVGVDTSPEMLAMARFISAHVSHLKPMWQQGQSQLKENWSKMVSQSQKIQAGTKSFCSTSFKKGNAEHTSFEDGSFDVVTIMYAFHEAPKKGRDRILREVRRVLSRGGVLAVIDIATDYSPSASMLAGEPYVIEYQKNIHSQLGNQKGFSRAQYKTLVPGHVGMWVLKAV